MPGNDFYMKQAAVLVGQLEAKRRAEEQRQQELDLEQQAQTTQVQQPLRIGKNASSN